MDVGVDQARDETASREVMAGHPQSGAELRFTFTNPQDTAAAEKQTSLSEARGGIDVRVDQ